MATDEGRCRRRHKNKPKKRAASRKDERPPTTVRDIPDHLFELVLLRLDSSTCLVRAAAACTRWRRVVADAGFLRRFRSLHAPRIAGHYYVVDPYYELSQPCGGVAGETEGAIFVPSSPLAVDSRRFSFGFLPDGGSWELVDCRGSLVLLAKKCTGWPEQRRGLRDLVVCEPLTGRYQGILCPADLKGYQWLGMFLLDGGDGQTGGRISMTEFRIMCALYEPHRWYDHRGSSFACVFSSGSDGGWRLKQGAAADDVVLPGKFDSLYFVGRAAGSLYWGIEEDDAVLALDEATAEFSLVLFPENVRASSHCARTLRVMSGDGDDGVLRVVRLMSGDLKVFARLPGSGVGDAAEWVLEKLLTLPEATRGLPGREERFFQSVAMIVAATASYILVTPTEKTWLVSVELETMEVEREHERNKYAGAAYPCELPWPPALYACADQGRGRKTCTS